MRVMLVEDDEGVTSALTSVLRKRGWSVRHAGTAVDAIELAEDEIDLVLLDMGLPDRDGLWVCRQLRATRETPIIALTARRTEPSMLAALRAGVDDYVTKPFSLAVLLARIDAVLRRTHAQAIPDAGPDRGMSVDGAARRVTIDEREVDLTVKEFALFEALVRGAGRPLSRAALMEEVWETTWVGASRTLDVHVAALRAKFNDAVVIETVRGVGYRLILPPAR